MDERMTQAAFSLHKRIMAEIGDRHMDDLFARQKLYDDLCEKYGWDNKRIDKKGSD